MTNEKHETGHGSGEVTIGPVTVPGRWRFSHAGPQSQRPGEFRFVIVLRLADRKKLVNLKKGDGTELTAGPFRKLPVSLLDLEYNDGSSQVSLTFIGHPAESTQGDPVPPR